MIDLTAIVAAILIALAGPTTGPYETADRITPPPATTTPAPTAPPFDPQIDAGACVGAVPLLEWHSPGWDAHRMARIMHRESRCQPDADNSRSTATGLLQILASHCPWLTRTMGEPCSAARLTDPDYHVRAAATLWLEQGYRAWSTTDGG